MIEHGWQTPLLAAGRRSMDQSARGRSPCRRSDHHPQGQTRVVPGGVVDTPCGATTGIRCTGTGAMWTTAGRGK